MEHLLGDRHFEFGTKKLRDSSFSLPGKISMMTYPTTERFNGNEEKPKTRKRSKRPK